MTSKAPKFEPVKERTFTHQDCRDGAAFLTERTSHKPKVAVVLGHGMAEFEACIEEANRILFEDMHAAIPLFPTCSSPPGALGAFIFGVVDGVPVLVMHGRFHYYEGHSAQAITFPIRIMKELGVDTILFVNSTRGLSPTLEIGDVMVITDHFNTERGDSHPLTGVNIDAQGPRFLRCGTLYDTNLRRKAKKVARQAGIRLKEGILIFISGPSFETPFEERCLRFMCERRGNLGVCLKYLRRWGTGLGLSGVCDVIDKIMNRWGLCDTGICFNTVPEVLVADHCGIRVLALSGVYWICKESLPTRPQSSSQESIKERQREEMKQAHIPPKMITLLRGIIQAQDDSKDIDIEIDTYDIIRWRIPTRLCVSWTSVFLGMAVGSLSLMLAPPLIAAALGEMKWKFSVDRPS